MTKHMAAMLVYLTNVDDQNSFVKEQQRGSNDVKYIHFMLVRSWFNIYIYCHSVMHVLLVSLRQ